MTRKRDYQLAASEIVEHSELEGLENDDHPQYMATDIAREISVQHTFNPFQVAPFIVGDDAADYLVDGLNADLLDGLEASDLAAAIHTHVKSQISDLETITTTPTAGSIPLADGAGKLDAGWMPSSVPTDFDISGAADHDSLYYDSGTAKWKNAPAIKLDNLGTILVSGSTTDRIISVETTAVNGKCSLALKNDAQEYRWTLDGGLSDRVKFEDITGTAVLFAITSAGTIYPTTTNVSDLGGSGNRWANGYFGTKVNINTSDAEPFLATSSAATMLCAVKTTATDSQVGFSMTNDVQQWVFFVDSLDRFAIRDNTGGNHRIYIDTSGNITLNGSAVVSASGSSLGFFGAGGTTIQDITGSRGGNAALANLLTALAAYGIITDSTT